MQLAIEGLQLGPQCGTRLVRHVDQVVLDMGLAPVAPIGVELAADLINAAGQVDVQAVEVLAGAVAHLDSVRGVRSIHATVPSRLIHE